MMKTWQGLLAVAAFAACSLFSRGAAASYSCPGGAALYLAYAASGGPIGGVRCVGFMRPTDPRQIQWYAEGAWGSFTYRNLGNALQGQQDYNDDFQWDGAWAADITGNGDSASAFTKNLNITTSVNPTNWNGTTPPAIIRITGDWNEIWVYSGGSTTSLYTSHAPPFVACHGYNTGPYGIWIAWSKPSQFVRYGFYGDACTFGDDYYGPAISMDMQRMWFADGQKITWAQDPADLTRTTWSNPGLSCADGVLADPNLGCGESPVYYFDFYNK